MRFGASTAGSLGLALLCGTIFFVGCGEDSGSGERAGGAGGKAGSTAGGSGGSTAGSTAGGTGGATGGTGGATGGTGGMAMDACPSPTDATGGVITDFEGTATTFDNGGYYIYADQDKGGTTTPDTSGSAPTIAPESGSYEGSGLHFSGTGFAADSWGAGVGVWMNCMNGTPVDGVSLWIKNDQAVRIGLTIPGTQSAEFNGECTAAVCTPNHYIHPAGDWTQVDIAWNEFADGTAPMSEAEILGLDILIPPPSPADGEWDFDVWIDNLSWLGGEPGGGGAGGGGAAAGGAGGDPGTAGAGGA